MLRVDQLGITSPLWGKGLRCVTQGHIILRQVCVAEALMKEQKLDKLFAQAYLEAGSNTQSRLLHDC